MCTTFTVRQGLSGQTSWCWRSHRLWLRFYPPSCTISIYVCVCCAPCVCSVNRPVPSLLSCLGGFVSCHAHVTRPSSRAKPSHQVAKCPSGNSFFMFLFLFFFFSHCLCCAAWLNFNFKQGAGAQGAGSSGSVCCKLSKLGNELGNWSDPIGCPPSLYVCTWSWGSLPPTWERTPQRVRLTHKEPCHRGRGGGAVGVGATSPFSLPSLRLDLNIAISFKWLPQLAFEQIYWISLGAAFYICGATTTTATTRYFLTAMRKMEVKSAPSKSKTNANLYPALQTRPICRSAALQWAHFKGISRMRRDAFCGFCGRTNIYIHLK